MHSSFFEETEVSGHFDSKTAAVDSLLNVVADDSSDDYSVTTDSS